jgi:OPA family glycerol-3-phosphate transporter-like MFS transporter
VYIARNGMLDCEPTYLKEVKHASLDEGGISTAALESPAIFSTILMGWFSHMLGKRRGMINVFCMIPVFLAYFGTIYSSNNQLWLDLLLFGVIGFFVYPAILLLVVSALDFTSKKAVGTAAGFLRLFGYLGRVVEGKGIGTLAERYGWNTAPYAIIASPFLGIVLLLLMWKLSPQRKYN